MKIVISDPKSGKAYQVEKDLPAVVGMKLGDSFDGSLVGLTGFTVQLTGGSDNEGFPMRSDLPGTARKKLLLVNGVGYRHKEHGIRKRKSVRGRTVSEDIVQLNLKITKGEGDIQKLLGLEKTPAEGEQEPTKKSEKKEEPKEEKGE